MPRATQPRVLESRDVRDALRLMLQQPRYEVLPLASVLDNVVQHVPTAATLTVTSSPTRGPGPTVEVATKLAARGYRVVPHLASRHYSNEGDLARDLAQLQGAGVDELFVVGGDAPVASGAYRDGEELLQAVHELAPDCALGVAGYPEGHPHVSSDALWSSMTRKAELATYVVTQLCLDPATVRSWIAELQRHGINTPVVAGVPGPLRASRLLRVGQKIGVGDSLRFLKGPGAMIARLIGTRGRFDPTSLTAGLVQELDARPTGLHIYTFNALSDAERWRSELLARLEERGTHD